MSLRVKYLESDNQHYGCIAEYSCPQNIQAGPHQICKISFQVTLAKQNYNNMSEVYLKHLNMEMRVFVYKCKNGESKAAWRL